MKKHLLIIWTNDHREVAMNMLLRYTTSAQNNGWWQSVTINAWGPTQKLIANDIQVQADILDLIHSGVKVQACKDCAIGYGFVEKFEKMGIDVKPLGEPTTQALKDEEFAVMTI